MKKTIFSLLVGAALGIGVLLMAGFRRSNLQSPTIDSIMKDRAIVACSDGIVLFGLLENREIPIALERLSIRLNSELMTLENISQRTPLSVQELKAIERGKLVLSRWQAAKGPER